MIIALFFIIIAVMRVLQTVCGKNASNEIKNNKTFFLYAIYYQILAAVFSFITVCFSGFNGLDLKTILCSLVTAVFLMIQFFANLYAIKGCKLIIASMFTYGGLLISCLLSWVFFDESMSAFQGVGLLLFFISAYLLSLPKNSDTVEDRQKSKITKLTWALLIISMLAEGGVELSQKYFSLKVTGGSVAWYSFFMFAFSAAIMSIGLLLANISDKTKRLPANGQEKASTRLNKTLLICGAALALAVFVINLLVTELGKKVSATILFPVSSSIAMCVTAVVGLLVYKEKLSVKNVIGVILGLISIIVLATFTPSFTAKIFGL